MLIATSNDPEQLDPAINNRPGRFDVVIEVPPPDENLRRAFLRTRLAGISEATIEQVARLSDGLSFAHLEEILRLSGLAAIHAGRAMREDEDVLLATKMVADSHAEALRGFPRRPEVPFGLLPLRDRHKANKLT